MYAFFIYAADDQDGSEVAVANVTIYVLDVNDNKPEFINETYNFQFYENTPLSSGEEVGQVNAIDADEGSMQPVSMSGWLKAMLNMTVNS